MTSSIMAEKRRETFTAGMNPPSLKYKPEKTDRSEKSDTNAMLMSENLNLYVRNSFTHGLPGQEGKVEDKKESELM